MPASWKESCGTGRRRIRLPAASQPTCDADEAFVVCHGTVGRCEILLPVYRDIYQNPSQ